MNSTQIICIIAGLAAGFLVAFISMLLTKKSYQTTTSAAGVMGASALRFILDAAILAAGYFICTYFGLPLFETLIGIAVGLSVGGMIFLNMVVKKMQKDTKTQTDEELEKSDEERSN